VSKRSRLRNNPPQGPTPLSDEDVPSTERSVHPGYLAYNDPDVGDCIYKPGFRCRFAHYLRATDSFRGEVVTCMLCTLLQIDYKLYAQGQPARR
jgi:hypothetical protein